MSASMKPGSSSASHALSSLPIVVSRFDTAEPNGPALGFTTETTWGKLVQALQRRREGLKDGPNIVAARFNPEPDGKVRRLKANVLARTALMMDCETHKKTGEIPPSIGEVAARIQAQGWAGVIYSSHNHTDEAPRFRIVIPMTAEIDASLPAVDVIAGVLHLTGVLDTGKLGASSVFYLPSSPPGQQLRHETVAIDGKPIEADWITAKAKELVAAREDIRRQQRAEALKAAEKRASERRAKGLPEGEKLIERIRDQLDLETELLRHGYTKVGKKFLYPQSETGMPGVYILNGNDGVQRVYSHHSGDPLTLNNLPTWCSAGAVDVVDVVTILDHGGNLKRALHSLAKRFNIEGPRPASAPPEEPPPQSEETNHAGTGPQQAHGRGIHWGEPVDFLADISTGAPRLEERHLPPGLWGFVSDVAERMGVDRTSVALASLVSCASVINDEWKVQPKRFDYTWTESARLWGAIVGDPSILKTPVISACTKPIDKLEAEARSRHQREMREWRGMCETAKADKQETPPQPRLDRYMVEGTTPEALSEVLRDDDEAKMRAPLGKVLSRHDEMSEFFAGLDKYRAGGKGGSERGAYLRLYNGGRYTVDRIGRGSFAVPSWSACFLGGCQPGPIQRIARDAADDGLLQRFLYVVPDRQEHGVDRKPDQAALDRYHALFPALAAMHPAAEAGSDTIRAISLSTAAHEHREAIDALARTMTLLPDTSSRLKAAFGKWHGMFARLCLTFHLVEAADRRCQSLEMPVLAVIQGSTAERVAAFMRDIVLPHLIRADAVMFATDQTGHARWIAGHILAHKMDRIAIRDVTRAYGALRQPEAKRELMSTMDSLVSVGWLEPEEPTNAAKGLTSWIINPAVHVTFSERAKAEAQRREATVELIRKTVAGTSAG